MVFETNVIKSIEFTDIVDKNVSSKLLQENGGYYKKKFGFFSTFFFIFEKITEILTWLR